MDCYTQELLDFADEDMNRGYRFSPLASQSRARIAALALLAIPAALRGQSGECHLFPPQVCDDSAELRGPIRFSRPVASLEFDAQGTSTATGNNTGAAEKPTQTLIWYRSAAYRGSCANSTSCACRPFVSGRSPQSVAGPPDRAADENDPGGDPKPPSVAVIRNSTPSDLNRDIYYKNKLELSLDGGWLPINIPFVFDVFLGDGYTKTPLNYTLVPIIASLRWQVDDVGGPWIFRGNWDIEASATVTLIPRGPETRYIAWIMGFRRNFVPRRGRIAPYFDGRLGLGNIDAKEPAGVVFAQGQDFTFTMNMGSGVRYNLNPRYSISAGLNWMHISNLYLSQPKFANYGINVYGPMFGVNVRLGKFGRHASE